MSTNKDKLLELATSILHDKIFADEETCKCTCGEGQTYKEKLYSLDDVWDTWDPDEKVLIVSIALKLERLATLVMKELNNGMSKM